MMLLQRAGQWRQELEHFLSTKRSRYTLVDHRSLVGIVMFVYVREEHIQDGAVKDVQVRYTALHYAVDSRHESAWHMHRLLSSRCYTTRRPCCNVDFTSFCVFMPAAS